MARGDTRRAVRALGADLRALLAIRWIRAVVFLVLLALGARAVLGLVLAQAADRLAGERELACRWNDLDLDLFSGRGELRDLTLAPRSGAEAGEPLVAVEYGVFDLELLPLLRGELCIRRAEIDGMDVHLVRDEAGEWTFARHVDLPELLELLRARSTTAEAEPAEPVEPETARALSLQSPLAVESLRLQHLRVHLEDRALDPPLDLAFETSARLSYLRWGERPTAFSIHASAGGLLDGALLEGELTGDADALQIALRAQAGSVRLAALAPYLAALDVRPASESIAARLTARISLAVIGEQRDALSATAEIEDLVWTADGAEQMALDRARIAVASISAERTALESIELSGLRGRAARAADGAWSAAGLDFLRAHAPRRSSGRWSDPIVDLLAVLEPRALPRWARLLAQRDEEAYPWSLGSLTLRAGELEVVDRAVEPEVRLPLVIDELALDRVVHDPFETPAPIAFVARLHAPGAIESIELGGSFGPFAPERSLDLNLAVEGIRLDSVRGHLGRAGLEGALERGSFRAHLSGSATTDARGRTEGELELSEMMLADQGELMGVRSIAARGLVLDPEVPLLRLGELELAGPQVSLVRDSSRNLMALGLRTLGFRAEPSRTGQDGAPEREPAAAGGPAEAADEPAPAASTPPLEIQIGRLAWSDSDVEFLDRFADPPRRFAFEEFGFELTDLTLGGASEGPEFEPARFTARMVAPGVLETFEAEGLVRSRRGSLDLEAELDVRGSGLQGRLLAPYLAELGIEPALADAEIALDLVAGLKEADGWHASLTLRNGTLSDGGAALASLGELRLADVYLGDTLEIGEVALVGPFVRLQQDASGVWSIAGQRLLVSPRTAPEPAPLELPALPPFHARALSLEGLRVAWERPGLEVEVLASAAARELGTLGAPAAFVARVEIPGACDALEVDGTLSLAPEELALAASVAGRGLRAGPLAPLLPPGLVFEGQDGRLELALEAALRPAPGGGLAARLAARGLAWGEAGMEPWLACDEAALDLARFDPLAGALELGPVTVRGARIEARRDRLGQLHALGLRLEAGAPTASAPAETEAAEEQPVVSRSTPDPSRIVITGPVSLELARVRLVDESLGPEARPLEAGISLAIDGPRVVHDVAEGRADELDFALEGAVDGLIELWRVQGTAAPFADDPWFEARLDARGVRTAGAVELVPALGALVRGEVEEGTLEASMKGSFSVHRARPTELGFSRPFGGELLIGPIAYRDRPEGTVLAGVDGIEIDLGQVDLERGLVHVRTLAVEEPRGVAWRDAELVHWLGFAIPLSPPPRAVEAAAPNGDSGAARPRPAEARAAADRPSEGAGELRIDELVVHGIDFEVRDESVSPALVVPFDELEVDVRRFTTRALAEARPITFSASLGAGSPPGEGGGEPLPPVFEEVALDGRVTLYPAPEGYAQVSLSGLELPPFAGLARSAGFELSDGALDLSTRLRLQGERGVRVGTSLVFTDLDVKEAEGGGIERALALPMPLGPALFLLRDQNGEHRFSIGFDVEEGGISTAQIAGAAVGALAEVLARALAAAPLRMLGTIVPLPEGEQAERVWELDFAPNSSELSSPAELRELAWRIVSERANAAVLSHELSAADVERAALLANPEPGQCLELVQRLRLRKADLALRCDTAALEGRTAWAIAPSAAPGASAELKGLERELAATEAALDGVLEMLEKDAPRQREKRTRAACMELAFRRLAAAQALLDAELTPDGRRRVELRPPRYETVPTGTQGGRVLIELRRR